MCNIRNIYRYLLIAKIFSSLAHQYTLINYSTNKYILTINIIVLIWKNDIINYSTNKYFSTIEVIVLIWKNDINTITPINIFQSSM